MSGVAAAKRDRGSFVFLTTADLGVQNGPSIHVLNLANALAERGFRVTLLAPRPAASLVLPLNTDVNFECSADPRRIGLPGGLASVLLLRRLWQHRNADVIYIRSSPASLFATGFARLLRPRCLGVEFNGWIADEAALLGSLRPLAGALARMQAWEGRLADKVRTVTADLSARVIASGTEPEKIQVIPTGTRLDTFRPLDRDAARRTLGLPLKEPLAVFVGNLWPAIDLQIIAQSVRLLHDQGFPLRVLIVGDGPLRPAFEAQLRTSFPGVCPVTFLGSLAPEEAAVVLGAADIALAPFVRERNQSIGLSPLKIRDYAAAGRVIVATALPGILDFADEPWLFSAEPENAAAFAAAIRSALAADRSLAEACARAFAEENFGWGKVAKKLGDWLTQ